MLLFYEVIYFFNGESKVCIWAFGCLWATVAVVTKGFKEEYLCGYNYFTGLGGLNEHNDKGTLWRL